jgi:hypothetical protein
LKPFSFYQTAINDFNDYKNANEQPLVKEHIAKRAYSHFRGTIADKPKIFNSELEDRYTIWKRLTKFNLSSEAKDLVWLLSHRALNTLDILKNWEIRASDKCRASLDQMETNLHPTIECPLNNEMWATVTELVPQLSKSTAEILADLEFECKKEKYYAMATIVTEALLAGWHSRNEIIFKNKTKTATGTKFLSLHRLRVGFKTDQSR